MDAATIDELLARVSLRDRAAFGALYDRTSAKLFGVCLRILNDRADAEDALQEAYVNIWRNCASFVSGRASAMSWLVAVARNAAIDRLRRRRLSAGSVEEAEMAPDDAPNPEQAAASSSEERRLAECLEELEPPQRAMVRNAFFSGRNYPELAAAEGMPLGTVKSWIRRSLQRLRQCLERSAGDVRADRT